MIIESDLTKLLSSLTYDNWFDMLPVIRDAYEEEKGWDAGQAVAWLIENRKRPYKFAYKNHHTQYLWQIIPENSWNKQRDTSWGEGTWGSMEGTIPGKFEKAMRGDKISGSSIIVRDLLIPFVNTWMAGTPIFQDPSLHFNNASQI